MYTSKNRVFPAIESYDVQDWKHVETEAVRTTTHSYLSEGRCAELLEPLREQLAKYPLYITLDKDVMNQTDCIQNWDSGYLSKKEVQTTCCSSPLAAAFFTYPFILRHRYFSLSKH